ncbi:MAG: hypothetical protein CVV42_03465 [Candidatus Riflebacteria bacterium HGW-Riflebacteria-2]|nr:MAG: hypothetical protein CVV42_03465 [Candidatus Riflebacteria bacterium HGW-Riflebacteria-2]
MACALGGATSFTGSLITLKSRFAKARAATARNLFKLFKMAIMHKEWCKAIEFSDFSARFHGITFFLSLVYAYKIYK